MGRNVALTRLTSLCALGSFPRQRQPRGNRICLQKHKNAGSFIPHFFPELRTTANKRAEKALFSRKSPKNFLIETKKLRLKKKKECGAGDPSSIAQPLLRMLPANCTSFVLSISIFSEPRHSIVAVIAIIAHAFNT